MQLIGALLLMLLIWLLIIFRLSFPRL